MQGIKDSQNDKRVLIGYCYQKKSFVSSCPTRVQFIKVDVLLKITGMDAKMLKRYIKAKKCR